MIQNFNKFLLTIRFNNCHYLNFYKFDLIKGAAENIWFIILDDLADQF